MPKPTLDQKRAKFALGKVESVLANPQLSGKRQKFLIELRHLPAQLHWGGLGQTAASLLADQDNEARQQIHKWLEEWLRESGIYAPQPGGKVPKLMQAITGRDGFEALQDRYVAATREARAIAVWLKKFAEAFLRGDAGKDRKERKHDVAAPQPAQ